jgi:hypothetical protein
LTSGPPWMPNRVRCAGCVENRTIALVTKVEELRRSFRAASDPEALIRRHSGLPGPRGNLELAQAAADDGDERLFRRLTHRMGSGSRACEHAGGVPHRLRRGRPRPPRCRWAGRPRPGPSGVRLGPEVADEGGRGDGTSAVGQRRSSPAARRDAQVGRGEPLRAAGRGRGAVRASASA